MKQLKDFLHLYLGTSIIASNGTRLQLASDNLEQAINQNWMPVLRPLSDMNDDEREEMKDVLPLGRKHDLAYFSELRDAANILKWCLDRRFDMFELIESGLAIDKITVIRE